MGDVYLSKETIIPTSDGRVRKFLRADSKGYVGFAEFYMSEVAGKSVRGWKKQLVATMNLGVAIGTVKFFIYDGDKTLEYILSSDSNNRLTVPSGYWYAFENLEDSRSVIVSILDIEHNENRVERRELDSMPREV